MELRESHRYLATRRGKPLIRIGDVVLIEDRDQPRGFWRLARVEKLLAGHDDPVRGAEVRVSTPTGRLTMLRRPVQALYPLELNYPPSQNIHTRNDHGAQKGPNVASSDECCPEQEKSSRHGQWTSLKMDRELTANAANGGSVRNGTLNS